MNTWRPHQVSSSLHQGYSWGNKMTLPWAASHINVLLNNQLLPTSFRCLCKITFSDLHNWGREDSLIRQYKNENMRFSSFGHNPKFNWLGLERVQLVMLCLQRGAVPDISRDSVCFMSVYGSKSLGFIDSGCKSKYVLNLLGLEDHSR